VKGENNEVRRGIKYHWQKVWYPQGINALTDKIFDFIFVAIEKKRAIWELMSISTERSEKQFAKIADGMKMIDRMN
jgi:hypothetical protein